MQNICNCWFITARGGGAVILSGKLPRSRYGLPQGSDDALRYIAEHDDALAFAILIAR